jgi:urease accessory protein
MLIASKLIPAGAGLAPVLLRRAATIELDWDTRQKSRFDATDSHGRVIGVFLPRGAMVRGGDVLVAEDGSLVAVKARPQAVLVVTPRDHGAPHDLLRAAYHLGNRHVPLEVTATHLQLEPDHVLAEMLRRMGLQVDEAEAPFEPEAGAYDATRAASGHGHHGHDHDHDHAHDHGHDHDHGGHSHR